MPLTRRSANILTSVEDPRQVEHVPIVDDASSASGSHHSVLSKSSRISHKALRALKLAELKKLKAETELEIAKLQLDDGEELDDVERLSPAKRKQVNRFLEDCGNSVPIEEIHKPFASQSQVPCRPFVELPKVELESFDGNPATYWKFVKQFEYFVEDRVSDSGQRLLYLIYYCKGRAKEAISECVMLPPEQAYERARNILRELFGQSHIVARSLIDSLFSGLRLLPNDQDALSRLSLKMENCYVALSQMNFTADLNSVTTIERLVRALPGSLQSRWARAADVIVQEGREVLFRDLADFVAAEARVARSRFGQIANSSALRNHSTVRPSRAKDKEMEYNVALYTVADQSSRNVCTVCDDVHRTESCPRFLASEVPVRWELIRTKGGCYRCLNFGHRAVACHGSKGCGRANCKGNHHTLLHTDQRPRQAAGVSDSPPKDPGSCHAVSADAGKIALGIVPVRLEGPLLSVETYALLDSGSDVSLVQDDLLREAGIEINPVSLKMQTVSGISCLESGVASFRLVSLDGSESIDVRRAYCLNRLPLRPVKESVSQVAARWSQLSTVDFQDLKDSRVRILLGADVPEAHWQIEQRLGGRGQPFAARTLLGWIMLGPVDGSRQAHVSINYVREDELSLEERLRLLYDAGFEDVGSNTRALSVEDNAALSIAKTSVRLVDRHFEVALPWRNKNAVVAHNYESARYRLQCLSRRLLSNPDLRDRYVTAMKTNITKGYAVPVPPYQLQPHYSPRWYLPHHAVINPKKPEKLRVVFDCAAKYRGVSLNDQLLQGPDTTADLVSILLRFRTERVAISADIEDMFMQVKVPEADRGALRFLWWKNDDIGSEVMEYQMTAHPFGATSSPFCANFALCQTAVMWGPHYNANVAAAVRHNFYVDDLLIALPSVSEAIPFVAQIREMLSKAGFKLWKWVCSHTDVYKAVPPAEIAEPVKPIAEISGFVRRTLGLWWNADEDTFLFQFGLAEKSPTRRGILSAVASIYDPLGLIAPVVMPAKSLLQRLCRDKLRWDGPVAGENEEAWRAWLNGVRALGVLKVPRCIYHSLDSVELPQLHVFCDASEIGYGAVAYVRFRAGDLTLCSLLYSKSRVAPLKAISIPRLELSAAVLAIRVFESVRERAQMKFERVWFWTDSTTVLYYINNTSGRFSTFVANRLSTIHAFSTPCQWRYVNSGCNPADPLSRGTYSTVRLDIWFRGPRFLASDEDEWPNFAPLVEPDEVEFKRSTVQVFATSSEIPLSALLRGCSDWIKLLRSVVWLTRFVRYLKNRVYGTDNDTRRTVLITLDEFNKAEVDVIRMTQNEVYGAELKRLEEANEGASTLRSIARRSGLMRLCPILRGGLLCLGGRLAYSEYENSFKFPAILPPKHPVTALLIRFYHLLEGHSGASQVLASLRRKYWIVRGLSAVKRLIGSCWTCRRRLATAGQQMMAPLPLPRVEKGWHPFKFVGVDYFGPFMVKHGRKREKRYGCLFTCLQTRAVHIELSCTLNTDSFIMALMRFVDRRGTPAEIFSDNGSNFVGAVAELRAATKEWSQRRINDKLLCLGVQWHFNPPASSHRGGVWERIIRSVRRVLLSIATQQVMCEEALRTLLVEAERIINSRPLVPLTSDPTNRQALTPNDLLILRPSASGLLAEYCPTLTVVVGGRYTT
ncbi:unnamed protein product [Dicrocoelium dendriticum]|nr:unnamed protein product [Dicrocoelium dendriticum]